MLEDNIEPSANTIWMEVAIMRLIETMNCARSLDPDTLIAPMPQAYFPGMSYATPTEAETKQALAFVSEMDLVGTEEEVEEAKAILMAKPATIVYLLRGNCTIDLTASYWINLHNSINNSFG